MEGNYSSLVSRILQNQVLMNAAMSMKDTNANPPTLNLVTKEWEATLKNNVAFQNCKFQPEKKPGNSTADYTYESSKEPLFNVTLVGYCRFAKPYDGKQKKPSVIIHHSEPLLEIARAMTKDLGSHIFIADEFKFNFKECSLLGCKQCRETAATFTKNGYKMNKSLQPCIANTKIFDGESILNRFYGHMIEMFPSTFIAIMHLRIDTRYNYTDSSGQIMHRIFGRITDFLAFHEIKLEFEKPINLGELTSIESTSNEVVDPIKEAIQGIEDERECLNSEVKQVEKEEKKSMKRPNEFQNEIAKIPRFEEEYFSMDGEGSQMYDDKETEEEQKENDFFSIEVENSLLS